jgi:hypothetical protein
MLRLRRLIPKFLPGQLFSKVFVFFAVNNHFAVNNNHFIRFLMRGIKQIVLLP